MEQSAAATLPVGLDIELFLKTLVRHLSGNLQDIVGVDEASGFISLVGGAIGDELEQAYRKALGVERLNVQHVAAVLVDLKQRIGGDFFIIEISEERIVLGARTCPFGAHVEGRPSLCMMTSNVFGAIAAENLGYARVTIPQSLATGAPGCRVIVDLKPVGRPEPGSREYFESRA